MESKDDISIGKETMIKENLKDINDVYDLDNSVIVIIFNLILEIG